MVSSSVLDLDIQTEFQAYAMVEAFALVLVLVGLPLIWRRGTMRVADPPLLEGDATGQCLP